MRITSNNTTPEQAATVLHRMNQGLLVVRGGPDSGKLSLIQQYVRWLNDQKIPTYVFANKGSDRYKNRRPMIHVRGQYTMSSHLSQVFQTMPGDPQVVIIDDIDNYMKGGMEMSAFRRLQFDAGVHMVVVVSDADEFWVAEGSVNYPWEWLNLDPTPPFMDDWDEAPHA